MADNWLKEYGFNSLTLPRRDLGPADVLHRVNGGFEEKVGDLLDVFSSSQGLAEATRGEPTGKISKTYERKVELNFGTKILGALFGASGSSKLGADLKHKRAKRLAVTYEDVKQDWLPVLPLQDWIETAQVKLGRSGQIWLNNEKLAAVTSVLRTNKLSIVAENESGVSIGLTVPEIQGLISGEANVAVESKSGSAITFAGDDTIAFGVQAYVMIFEGNYSFGLERVKGLQGVDPVERAWTADNELREITVGGVPEGLKVSHGRT